MHPAGGLAPTRFALPNGMEPVAALRPCLFRLTARLMFSRETMGLALPPDPRTGAGRRRRTVMPSTLCLAIRTQALRDVIGKPLIVLSGYRGPASATPVPMEGTVIDIAVAVSGFGGATLAAGGEGRYWGGCGGAAPCRWISDEHARS
jgi:hypothetical protein